MPLRKRLTRKWSIVLLLLVLCLIVIQFIRPRLDNPAVTADIAAPPEVKQILVRACYDCHSNQTRLAWFDQVAPAYWLVREHILDGRKVLNFSEWDSLSGDQQKGKLFESLNQVQFTQMPLAQYTAFHPGSKITGDDIKILRNYLDTLAPVNISDPKNDTAGRNQYAKWVKDGASAPAVNPVPNGLAYMPDYKNWEAISTTERFDNGTMRVILGNEIAVKAIKEFRINPWPDGTRFAKVAWTQVMGTDGDVHTGEFKQVEFMVKDSHKYAATDGWGFGRWKTMELKPYGKTAAFTTECTNCHKPMRDYDFVFTQPLNLSAIPVPDSTEGNPLERKVISSSLSKTGKTLSTLYGNELALKSARTGAAYGAGSVLTLVTWRQKEDEHWFGARIPGEIQAIEEIRFSGGTTDSVMPSYEKYEGKPLKKNEGNDPEMTKRRIAYIVGQKASVMP